MNTGYRLMNADETGMIQSIDFFCLESQGSRDPWFYFIISF